MALAFPVLADGSSTGIRIAEILRVSSDCQAVETRAGLDRQRAVNQRTIEAKGLYRALTIELHVSGTVAMHHPEMRRVLAMISDGTIRGVVCAELDRIFRPDQPQGFAILQVFQDMDAKIYTGDSEYDLRTSSGLLQSSIRGAIAGFELSLIRERMQGAKEAKRRQGKCPTNAYTLPLGIGYDRSTDTWTYTPEIAKVKLLFDLFQQGTRNYSELGRRIGLSNAGVKFLLKNRLYTGWRIIDQKRGPKRTSVTGKLYRVKVARAPEDVIRNKVLDGIISEEAFEEVQREIARTKFNFIEANRSSPMVHLATGVLVCGCCGQPMFLTSRSKIRASYVVCKSNYYLYKNRMGGCQQPNLREDETDAALIKLVGEVLATPERLVQILEASARKTRELITPFSSAVAPSTQIEELKRRDARLVDAFAQGVLSVDELRSKREAIRRERDAFEQTLKPKPSPDHASLLLQARLVVKAALRFSKIGDRYQQKVILNELFSEIHVRRHEIISFKFRPSAMGGNEGADQVLLAQPVRIGSAPMIIPEGHRHCIKCLQVKPKSQFYRNLSRCNPCRKAADRENYQQRKAARSAKKPLQE